MRTPLQNDELKIGLCELRLHFLTSKSHASEAFCSSVAICTTDANIDPQQ